MKASTLAGIGSVAAILITALPVSAVSAHTTFDTAVNVEVGQGSGSSSNSSSNAGVSVNTGTNASSSGSNGNATAGISAGSAASSSMEGSKMDSSSGTSVSLTVSRDDINAGTYRATMKDPAVVKADSDLSGFVAAQMRNDMNISAVDSSNSQVSVVYPTHARLFGFIPVTVNATAVLHADGTVKVRYPWYAFLMAKDETDLQSNIESSVAADKANGTFSASAQARVIANMRAAFEHAWNEASTSANTSANVTANGSVETQ